MGKFDSILDDVYGKEDKKITSVLDEVYGPEIEPITMTENPPTPIADFFVGLNRGVESAGEAIAAPVQRLFTAPPNQDVVVPEELDMSSMQAVRDRQAMIPPKAPVEPGYVPPAGITEGLEAALPIAYQATKKGISGAIQAAAENIPVTSFPTEPIAKYAKGVGEEAQKQIEQTIQEKQIRPGTAGAFTADVASSMAQFLPIAGMSIIAPSVAPAGLAFLATVSGGDKYQRAKEAGFGEGEALAQGIAYGAAEAIGEKIGLDYLLAAAKNPAVMSGVKTIFVQGLKQAGVEGAEEGLTQIIQNATDIVAKKARPETKGEAPGLLQDVPYAMGVGAAAGGATGGGLSALQSMPGQQQAPPQTEQEAPKEEVAPEKPIRETPTATEPAPQNMEQTTEFLTRKPAVTIGEAERLQGEAIPKDAGMTIQPTAPTNRLDQLFKRKPSKTLPQPQQTPEVVAEDMKPQPVEQMPIKTPDVKEQSVVEEPGKPQANDVKNLYKYNEESQNNIIAAQQFESASIERADGTPAIKTIVYRWAPKQNGEGGKLLKDVFLDNKKESSEIYNEYENKIDAVKDAYNNTSTIRSDRKSFFIDESIKQYDTEVQNAKMKNERRAKISEQVQSEIDNKIQEIEQVKNDLNTKYHTELAREYKAAGILFEKVKPSKYKKTFKGQIEPTITKENKKQIKEISSRVMDKIKKENKTIFDEITNFKADDYKNKLIEERIALAEGKPVPPEVLAEYPDLKPTPEPLREVPNILKTGKAAKQETFTDKSVKDLPQKAILNNGVIEVGHTQPKKYKGQSRYTITIDEWERAKKSSGNPEYGIRRLVKQKWFDLTKPELEQEAVAERVVDSQISAIKEVLKNAEQPRPKTGPGMFGGATMQNLYEQNIEPVVKKGVDALFRKRAKAYEQGKKTGMRTEEDLTKGLGLDITQDQTGKVTETEHRYQPRPRIGLFNLQNVYDALTRPIKQRAEDKRFKEHLDNTMAQGPRQRMEEARGLDKLSFFDRAKKAAIRLKELSTRKFPDLDDTKFPEFANKLRVLDGGKDYAEGTAGYLIHETIKDLSPEEYNVFGTGLILEDLQKGIDTGLYTNDLPFGYDAQTLAADRRAIDPAELRRAGFNDKADRIEAAVQKRNDFMREVKQEAVNNGLLPEAVMNDDRYFHHQVLQYMNMKEEGAGAGGKKDVRIGKKGYRMSRTGSLKDFNTEYAQAEFEVLSQMIEDNKKAEFLKYVESLDITPNLRAEADLQGLPKDAATLKRLMPEGYTLWQPQKGNNFYKVFTIPERIVEEIIARGDAVDVSMDDINEALAVGAPKKTLIIPEGLVKTLDNFGRKKTTGLVGTIGKVANKIWKTSMLFMPSRVTNYMLTNFFGDADVVLAYQGKILGNLPDAMKELYANDRKNNADLEKAYKQQVIGANITEKEIASIDYNSINKPFNIMRYLKNPLNVGKDYLQKAVRMNAFRENSLRYAAFKHFLSELRAGKKNIYAASDRAKIDSITNLEEKAATLARDLLGDYGNVSALGEDIAENLIPFYRWMEVNTPRYYRMLKNAPFEGGYEGAVKGGYKALKRFVQMNIVGTILYQLYHAAIGAASGDDELQKARDVTKARGQLHSLLPNWLIGDDKKDIVRTVRTQGAASDVTETLIGTSDLFSDFVDVASGRTKFRDKMRELGWKLDNPADFFNIPPIRKYTMAALPLARTFAETVSGRAATRSLMETRPIRDRMQHFARAMALGAPYNIATDKPGPERAASDLVTYKTNLGEIAYNEITRKKFEFLRERGYPLPSGAESPAGTAYYNLKQAVKFGDKKQIRKYFKEYNQERRKLGKDTADWYDVKERIKESADPSSFMKEELWDEFKKTLTQEDKRKLREAMRWFKETYK